jgi:Ca2+-binding EF-hand superfamily protein
MALHRSLIFAFAALPFLLTNASAQGSARYRDWDRNYDGVITRAEWRGTLQEFRERDWNRDGVLSGNEVRDDDPSTLDNWDAQTFVTLDRNRNGRLSRGEWRGDLTTFRRVDRNADNQITRAEFMNAAVSADDEIVEDFDTLDYDRTGRIERDEWNGTRAAFNRLDTNRDGVLTRRELSGSTTAVSRGPFDTLDYNNNGVISVGEWRSGYGNFSDYDRNRDGIITRGEYNSGTDRMVLEDTIIVDSREPWTTTNVYVNAGDVVTYRAEGTIQMSTNGNDRSTPAGSVSGRTAKNSPRPDQRAGGLLIRVGNGSVVFAGENGSFTAQSSGQLYLGVNDDHFPDNNGQYRVVVSVRQQ